MIRVTIYNEYVQERLDSRVPDFFGDCDDAALRGMAGRAREIRQAHPAGSIHATLRELLEECDDIRVRHVATLEDAEQSLSDAVLEDTDVLLWWGHVAHGQVPDAVAARVRDHVQRGMGAVFLHSAHMSKPMALLLGTSCTLRWREGDQERLWCCAPAHPIARGVEPCVFLEEEEMYGEYFDIPAPDELVFLGGFRGGEVFRSGCVWDRGYGKVFYFQPGHETNRSYFHPGVRRILQNAVRYLSRPELRQAKLECLAV